MSEVLRGFQELPEGVPRRDEPEHTQANFI